MLGRKIADKRESTCASAQHNKVRTTTWLKEPICACFGAGTPKLDDFAHLVAEPQAAIAPYAFVAALPKALLGHPNGALAIVGHVERAWSYSFLWEEAGGRRTQLRPRPISQPFRVMLFTM
jgi:hypothetical protein